MTEEISDLFNLFLSRLSSLQTIIREKTERKRERERERERERGGGKREREIGDSTSVKSLDYLLFYSIENLKFTQMIPARTLCTNLNVRTSQNRKEDRLDALTINSILLTPDGDRPGSFRMKNVQGERER